MFTLNVYVYKMHTIDKTNWGPSKSQNTLNPLGL